MPLVSEVLSYIKVYTPGDGFVPRIREGMKRANIQGWAKLYLDPSNAMKTQLLMVMSPQQFNEFNQELLAMTAGEQSAYLEEFIQENTDVLVADNDEDIDPSELNPQQVAQFWYFAMPTFYNSLSYIAHRKSIYQLVAEAIGGNDESFLKAIQVDKSTLAEIPYFVERNRRAADEGDINFLRQINTYRQKPILQTKTKLLPLVMLLSYLYQMNLLDAYSLDMEKLLRLCERTGIYGNGQEVADLESFKKVVRQFMKQQQIPVPRSSQKILVKDACSSKSRP
ncbi:MAG: hypothetical protein HYY97_11815 [Rhodocyclales bacterium]|nr:hypothetical protein [Rhodocyclales bacterium]